MQYVEYRVLRELVRALWEDKLLHKVNSIPSDIVAKNEAPMRCCIYKDRVIIQERIKIAIGANDEINKKEVIKYSKESNITSIKEAIDNFKIN